MSTKYFILTKDNTKSISSNEENQVYNINSPMTFILPSNNIEYYIQHGLFESPLIEWSKQYCNPNKVFLDIGAHTGTYSICFARLCQKVYSFEPQRQTYYALCGSVALSNIKNVECINVGLGSPEQVGIKTLNIISNDGGGSSVQQQPSYTPVLATENIEIRTLDSFGFVDVGFIKMDIEGNELDCLRGSVETIQRCRHPTVLFESNSTENTELFNFIINVLGYSHILTINGVSNMYLAVKQ
jgi:FkbM family methyltransferase